MKYMSTRKASSIRRSTPCLSQFIWPKIQALDAVLQSISPRSYYAVVVSHLKALRGKALRLCNIIVAYIRPQRKRHKLLVINVGQIILTRLYPAQGTMKRNMRKIIVKITQRKVKWTKRVCYSPIWTSTTLLSPSNNITFKSRTRLRKLPKETSVSCGMREKKLLCSTGRTWDNR